MNKILIDEATVTLALELLAVATFIAPKLQAKRTDVINAGLKALAEQPAQQGSTCNNTLRIQGKGYPRTCKKCGFGPCVELANTALDKKAKNAKELGLDYEPLAGTQVSKVWWDGEKLMAKPIPFVEFYKPVQQEPWPEEPAGHKAGGVQLSGTSKSKAITELYALFGAPHNADINLTGLNRLLDELIASPPAQRKPLTVEQIYSVLENLQVMYNRPPTTDSRIIFARAIEAAHGIKENT